VESIVRALGPAFAAGFAVQRLVEIVDALLSGRLKDERKKGWLMGLALLVGLVIAFAARLRVLQPLGADVNAYLDYLVAALVISAGTEGFNSILKFLSYKKEEKKAEAVQQKAVALDQLNRGGAKSLESPARAMERALAADLDDFVPVTERLKEALKTELIRRWADHFIDDDEWEGRAFGEYSNHLDAHKEAVRDATLAVAGAVGTSVPQGVMVNLQKKVTLDTTPKGIVPHMRDAVG